MKGRDLQTVRRNHRGEDDARYRECGRAFLGVYARATYPAVHSSVCRLLCVNYSSTKLLQNNASIVILCFY